MQLQVNKEFVRYLKYKRIDLVAIIPHLEETGEIPAKSGLTTDDLRLFQTALQIPIEYHIKHQAGFQKYTENGVSKTINLPFHSGPDQVSEAFMGAWRLGAKGITVFRSGCKENQVLNTPVPTMSDAKREENPCKIC